MLVRAALPCVWGILLVCPDVLAAPTTEVLRAYHRFEEAKAANDHAAASRYGREALALSETSKAPASERIELMRSLAEVLAASGEPKEAIELYRRSILLQESEIGAEHPDLIPALDALATLHLAAKEFEPAEAILRRVLAIERTAFGEKHENVRATLAKLRDLHAATGRTADVERIETEIERLDHVERAPPRVRERRYKHEDGAATVRVFYGTNRAPTGESKPSEFYGRGRGDLQYGYLDVSIPETHREGELETQSRWSVLTYFMDEDARKRRFVLLQDVAPLARDEFASALRTHIGDSPSRDVLVFVHGYNSSFDDAARRTAQLAYDLDFDGTPMLFSWPSQRRTAAYTVDEAAAGISGLRMARFLETVLADSGAQRIHLVAHSMGNRVLLEALQTLLAARPPEQRRGLFGQVVFTAPDVDRDYFIEVTQPLRDAAERVTLYASNEDLALKTSQLVHGAPRAGLAGAGIVVLQGLDTIDMSSVKADLLGHNYYAADAGAIYDLFRLLWRGDPPPRRCGMSSPGRATSASVWTFNVEVCKGHELLLAGVLVKRFGARARARVRSRIEALADPSEKQLWSNILVRLDGLLTASADETGGTH